MRSAKVMLLGDIGVGKSSLARRFVFDRFDGDYKSTLGVDVFTHDIALGASCEGAVMRIVLWDTDGDFRGGIFKTPYFIGASAAIIVADATRPATFVTMAALASQFAETFPGRPVAAIVNKIDLVPGIAEKGVGDAIAPEFEIVYTSAKTGAGVVDMFTNLGAAIWRRRL